MIVYYHAGTAKKNFVSELLKEKHGILSPVFFKNEHGKPYLEGNPLFFNLSHSREIAVLAVCEREVGIDVEKLVPRSYGGILRRCSERERAEIRTPNDFLTHWTVKESFVKYLGLSIAEEWKALEYFGGTLFWKEEKQAVFLKTFSRSDCVFTVCTALEEEITLLRID